MSEIVFPLKPEDEFIELFKLLKITGLCDSGGAAKYAISEGQVKINGVPETRKAFKVRAGSRVEFRRKKIIVSSSPNAFVGDRLTDGFPPKTMRE